jgi:hypothetical protein
MDGAGDPPPSIGSTYDSWTIARGPNRRLDEMRATAMLLVVR